MAATLYAREPTFRAAVDRCVAVVRTASGVDLSPVLCHARRRAGADLRTLLAGGAATLPAAESQTATFIVEYAMTELLATWGIAPRAVLGSSLGEYAAACAAGVWTLEDALRIVMWRAAAIAKLPGGVMLAVPLDAATLTPLLPRDVTVAIVAGPQLTVVAGPASAVEDVEGSLTERSVVSRRLATTHALHTAMMAPMRAALEAFLAGLPMRPPQIPYVSGLTGTWATDRVATPAYWGRHLCEPVQLAAGIDTLRQEPERVWLEVGPGQSLTTLLKQHPGADPRTVPAVATMRGLLDGRTDEEVLAEAVGQLWLSGAAIDWAGYHQGERRRRVPLPTYPFERQRQRLPVRRQARSPATADAHS
jgi:acyl transferase domain-containing protein